jgi:hypothetical protein
MGVNPLSVGHLTQCAKHSGENLVIENMQVSGDATPLDPPFVSELPGLVALAEKFGVQIIDGAPCSSCVGALYLSLKKLSTLNPELLATLQFAVGPDAPVVRPETICFGSCCCASRGILVRGCPPVSNDLMIALQQ